MVIDVDGYEYVAWRRFASTHPVSNLHLRLPGTLRTRCGLKVPEHGISGEVLEARILSFDEWDGLHCARCFPETAEATVKASRSWWQQVDRTRAESLLLPAWQDFFSAGASEVWQRSRRGSGSLVRIPERGEAPARWELWRSPPGATGRRDLIGTLEDGARPRLRPPLAWANGLLSGRRSG